MSVGVIDSGTTGRRPAPIPRLTGPRSRQGLRPVPARRVCGTSLVRRGLGRLESEGRRSDQGGRSQGA